MSEPRTLDGKTALVTGGTRGIGRAIAERLLRDGADVVITGTRRDGRGPEGTRYEAADFADEQATQELASRVAELGIDILVNNAGINKISPFAEIERADFARIQRVNVTAPFMLCQAVVPTMRARGWGRIVTVSSIFGIVSREQRAAYSTSKFGVDGMTAALAAEVARDGILANCVAPGFIDTDLTRRILGEEGMAELSAHVPARRPGKPEEVAALVAWLVGPENTYVSGQNLVIDGGFTRV